MTFRFLPGERLNEALLAKELGVSRTPLREALNRLSAEGFLTFSANNGFFRKMIDVKEIFDLYEFRMYLEQAAIRLAVDRATDAQIAELEAFSAESARHDPGRDVDQLVSLDEQFHETLVSFAGNSQMLESLRNINARIQFVRWLDMSERRAETQNQHQQIVAALKNRDRSEADKCICNHISHRLDQIVDKVERSYGRIFVKTRDTTSLKPAHPEAEPGTETSA